MGTSSDMAIESENILDKTVSRMENKLDLILKDKRVDAFNRRQELRTRLANCIQATDSALKEKRVLEINRQDTQNLQKYAENQAKTTVNEEMVGDKKKYTNQEQRETATALILAQDPEYQRLNKSYTETSIKITELIDTLEILKLKFRSAQAEVELEKLEV